MFQRRLVALLKDQTSLDGIQELARPSAGRRVVRGAVIGSLAGGILGLAIEMSPDEYGIKQKVNNAISEGRRLFEATSIPDKPLVVSKPRSVQTPPPPPPKKPEEIQPEDDRLETQSVSTAEPVSEPAEQLPETIESPTLEDVSPINEEETAIEVPILTEEQSVEPEPYFEPITDTPDSSIAPSDEPPRDNLFSTIESMELEISRLKSELETAKLSHETDLARAAGAAKASLETIDRMYNERQVAMSVARQSILVSDLLDQLASDDLHTSPGSLKVDFEHKKKVILESCFQPLELKFVDLVLSKLFCALYSLSAGKTVLKLGDADLIKSPTWRNIRALHLAEDAIEKNEFLDAMNHLETIRNFSAEAAEWVDRARQALELRQGSRAALASMHDELSRVL